MPDAFADLVPSDKFFVFSTFTFSYRYVDAIQLTLPLQRGCFCTHESCSGDSKMPVLTCSSFFCMLAPKSHCERQERYACNSPNLTYSCLVTFTFYQRWRLHVCDLVPSLALANWTGTELLRLHIVSGAFFHCVRFQPAYRPHHSQMHCASAPQSALRFGPS